MVSGFSIINQSSKGEKGQFFTPRYVIDMCVKMLNPLEDEYMIDTAAGSSGFPVHTIFYVWKQILEDEGIEASHLFSIEEKPAHCKDRCDEYVQEKVFAIDFDEKAVRVARTLNLIAGDGQTNVLHLNTLDYKRWDERIKDEAWQDVYFPGWKRLKKLRPKGSKDYREFQFDILMANPPFAGDIKERDLIARYDLGIKPNGKQHNKLGRDILFIERNLDFLKPGGRMAIVLPQGRFNNSSDKQIRDFIAERCRILAVVGLHGNTFKPHTGTKTSVLFVQKWNDNPKLGALCPKQDDYNIFFATMRKSGKDNSGEKIYRRIISEEEENLSKKEKDRQLILDNHDHLVVDHDLYNHDGMTEDGIAEAFIEFAKKEKLSFFEIPPSNDTPLIKGGMGGSFDAEKYERLMDRLEAISIQLSELENLMTLGAEFYQKHYVDCISKLKISNMELDFLEKISLIITDGDHSTTQYQDEGIYYILSESVKEGYIDENIYRFISPELHKQLKRSELKARDIVITKTGVYFGRSAVIPDNFIVANTSAHIGKIRVDENQVNAYYLSTFFNSQYGYLQLRRRGIKATRPEIKLVEFNDILVAKPNKRFQNYIEKIINKAGIIRNNAKNLYQQAEELLLSELGLKDWQPTEKNIAVKSFAESFGKSDRLDAEHYQPKFDQLIAKLKGKVKLTRLGKLLTCNQRGKQPSYLDDDENYSLGLPVVNSKHVREGQVIINDNRYAEYPNGNNPLIIQTDDVLINGTGVGTIGRCAPYLYQQDVLPDNHVTILRNSSLDPVYLSIFINSIVGQFQVEKYLKGSSGQIELYPKDIAEFWIWEAPDNIQQSIRDKVEESHHKCEQSKQLLEIAKTGVEKAIEENEERATNWINQQLKQLEIKL